MHGLRLTVLMTLVLLLAPWSTMHGWHTAMAAQEQVETRGRPIREIRIHGLNQVPEQLVRNQIRMNVGDGYDPAVVEQDIVRITYLNRFESVTALVQPQDDGTIVLTYQVREWPLIADTQVVGNKEISDQELLNLIGLQSGDPADPALITRGINRVKRAYEEKGYFIADITYDRELLAENAILIFNVREGPRVRVTGLTFEGNKVFDDDQLQPQIRTRTHIPILRKGILSREQVDADAARLREFYQNRGYLDAEVAGEIRIAPDYRDATVVFTIREGRKYLVDSITIEGNEVFTDEQILQVMALKVGDIYSSQLVDRSRRAIYDLYGKLGYIETRLVRADGSTEGIDRVFHESEPLVDVVVRIREGLPYIVGAVHVTGNEVTQQKVIVRQLRGLNPGERFDRSGIELSQRRINGLRLFSEARISVMGESHEQVRDVLVEVHEQNTGELTFGAGFSSDVGLLGAISMVQRNFDITDFPESTGEFFRGKAFRGAGQYFAATISPGDRFSRYSVTFREPYFLESPFFLETGVFLYTREREEYDEGRWGGTLGLGQRFGDVWSAQIRGRFEEIELDDITNEAPVDVFEVEGESLLTTLEFTIIRDTADDRIFPTRGSRTSFTVGRAGALGGDYDFTRIELDWINFWTIDEDFFGRKSVLSLRSNIGYIFEDAPVFERFYAGGHRTIRGFEFRGAGPRGVMRNGRVGDDPVGGEFMFLLSVEYNFPLVENVLRGVVFTDTGTVRDDIGFDDYRVSVGAGVRLALPMFGQVPIALDFAVPVLKEKGDEERLFSFDVAVPFR